MFELPYIQVRALEINGWNTL